MTETDQKTDHETPTGAGSGAPDLFTPYDLGGLALPHRVVMAPMTRNRAGEGFAPTELNARYYAQRASAALVITEASQVSRRGLGYPDTPGIYDDEQIRGWRRVTRAVHDEGGRIFVQLFHTGRISHPDLQPDGQLPVAPSSVKPEGETMTHDGMKPFVTPRALETGEIAAIVEEFRAAAANAREAGFDGVEVHGANGYLIDQFLRDRTNRRDDGYGGSPANRFRLLGEVLAALFETWPSRRVGVRISPSGTFNDMGDSDPEATFEEVVSRLDELDLGYLHVIEANETDRRNGATVVETELLRRRYGGALMVNGGYDRESGERAVARGLAELVSFGTPFLANPDLPRRLRLDAELNEPDSSSFYGGGREGYVDYPTLDEAEAA